MGRRHRYSQPHDLVEVTAKCIQGRFLLEGSPTLSRRIVGWWEKGRRDHDIKVYGFVTMSNHLHAIVSGPSSVHISNFMNYVQGQTATEVTRCTGWEGKVWAGRYKSASILDDASSVARLTYIVSNSVKEGLVADPRNWPLVHCARALTWDLRIPGEWVDRKRKRRERGKNEADYTVPMNLELSPLPMFAGLGDGERAKVMKELVDDVVATYAPGVNRRAATRRWKKARDKRKPFHRPEPKARGQNDAPAPTCHTVSEELREAFEEGCRRFVMLYREASSRFEPSMGQLGYPLHSQVMSMARLE